MANATANRGIPMANPSIIKDLPRPPKARHRSAAEFRIEIKRLVEAQLRRPDTQDPLSVLRLGQRSAPFRSAASAYN
jgi:hypothetical protein